MIIDRFSVNDLYGCVGSCSRTNSRRYVLLSKNILRREAVGETLFPFEFPIFEAAGMARPIIIGVRGQATDIVLEAISRAAGSATAAAN